MANESSKSAQPQALVPSYKTVKTVFRSFDGGVTASGNSCRPSALSLKDLSEVEEKLLAGKKIRIARGAGLSFAAASFAEQATSVDFSGFDKILGYDQEQAVVEVEAGATMGDIYNYLIGRERYLVTQPGYPSITVGGCIAVDIHGKNQFRDGNFSDHVQSIKLFHPAYGVIEVSERFNKEIFDLTLGGYGLTGHILSARVKTRPLPGKTMSLVAEPIESFENTPALIAAAAKDSDFTVTWHDLSAAAGAQSAFGAGFVLSGKFLPEGKSLTLPVGRYIDSNSCAGLGFNLYSLPLTRLINVIYGGLQRRRSERAIPVYECLYPSKRLRDFYYQLFGPAGFHESQLIVPEENFAEFAACLRQWLADNELPVTLASAKYFGGQQRLLRFAGKGICFALNFPRCANSEAFLRFLDKLTIRLNLVPYIVKDSRLPAAVIQHAYPQYGEFRERLQKYDRDRLFHSELSDRLEL